MPPTKRKSKSVHAYESGVLPTSQKILYGMPRGTTQGMALLLQTTVRFFYIEGLGLRAESLAVAIAVCKSLDFLIGFGVGYATDNLRSRWGRRKPFIAVGFPIWIAVMLAINNPPASLGRQKSANATMLGGGVCREAPLLQDCAALRNCTSFYGAGGASALPPGGKALLPTWDGVGGVGSGGGSELTYAGSGLLVYYMVCYFLFYSVGFSTTIIPYDALGMELTDDYAQRSSVFGVKAAFQFGGYLLLGASGFYFSSAVYPDDIGKQIRASSVMWAVLNVAAFGLLLACLQTPPGHDYTHKKDDDGGGGGAGGGGAAAGAAGEGAGATAADKTKDEEEEEEEEEAEEVKEEHGERIVPSIRQLFFNREYVTYLWMKVPLAMAGLMPVNFLLYYLKLVQREENAVQETALVTVIVVLTAVLSVPVLVWCANRYTKRATMCTLSVLLGFVFVAASLAPATRTGTYVLAMFMGVGAVGTNMLPDAMLADIIDYGELASGRRSEGTYTVVETNLQQFIEIPAGTLPLLVLSAVGFVNNAGCDCGCGVKCDDPFIRWNCPSDVGYACGTGMGDTLLYGAAGRVAPCTEQNSAVLFWVRVFGIFIPGLCYFLGAWPVWCNRISPEVHRQIVAETDKRRAGLPCRDPIRDEPIVTGGDEEEVRFLQHFSARELRRLAETRSKDSLGRSIKLEFVLACAALAAVVGVAGTYPNENVITIAALVGALIFIGA
jgi:Na+/melibiose symporter-like transporter